VTIPAHLVDWLHQAAYTEIGLTAETLDTAAFSTEREAHPAWFRGPAETLRDIYALLDIIGWAKSTSPNGLQIDPGENSWTVIRTLTKALEIADQEANETTPSTSTHNERGTTPTPNADTERANALWNFKASIDAHTDTLAVEEGTDDVLGIAA
jgi:hypothetical protein